MSQGKTPGYFIETIVLFAAGLAIAYGGYMLAGCLGFPVSGQLIQDGQWIFLGWSRFPWLECTGLLVGMAILPLAWERHSGISFAEIGFGSGRNPILFFPGILGLLFVFIWLSQAPLSLLKQGLPLSPALFYAILFLIVAFSEEILFRGILQRRLAVHYNRALAIGLATIAFVAWHGLPGSGYELVLRLSGALFFALLYDLSKSLWPSVLLHWLINLGQV